MKNLKQLDNNKQTNDFVKYSSLGIQMVVIILIFAFAGVWIDKWLKWQFPLFTVLLTLISVFLALYSTIKELTNKNK